MRILLAGSLSEGLQERERVPIYRTFFRRRSP
jgi:hypothetical protein